jgi:hypothetical protein
MRLFLVVMTFVSFCTSLNLATFPQASEVREQSGRGIEFSDI